MSRPQSLRRRQDFLHAQGVLVVVRNPPVAPPPVKGQPAAVPGNPAEGPEILLSVWDDGRVVALHGHVDLGTGIRTAFAQIVAEELDVGMDQVEVILGDTGMVPNQGPTIASSSIQIHGVPLRLAAAQARQHLLSLAARQLQVGIETLSVARGRISVADATHGSTPPSVSYADLVAGQHIRLMLDPAARIKSAQAHTVVGRSVPRVDIPAKALGELTFVHDMRLPHMLHGRVVRPPYAGADHGDFVGNLLESVDESSIAHIPGIRAVVVIRDFVGIVADREENAEQAALALQVRWKAWPGLTDLSDVEHALRNNPATPRRLVDEGDVDHALDTAQVSMTRTYIWPYQMHASIGPSCAVAHWTPPGTADPITGAPCSFALTVWAGTQNPHVLRADLSRLTSLDDVTIEIVRMEAAGCYGRNGADDVAADAVLLSRAVGAPVRVQLTREQENLWEPKGAAQWMEVRGGLQENGTIAGYDFSTSYPSNGAPTLALLLTRTIEPLAQTYEMGDRTARPPYSLENIRVTVNDMPPILRASWLRGVSALPNSFAHESYIDELATAAGVDPLDFRLRYLDDTRAQEILQATAQRAGWKAHTEPQGQGGDGDILHGQGVAYARYTHSKWPGFGAAWAAWIADVDVNKRTGEVHVRRVVVGHDAGLTINPAGVEQQVNGNVLQTTSRALTERLAIRPRDNTVAAREWGAYPILSFRQVPVIEVMQMPRPNEPSLGAGESASVPGTAAIANAIFDATGVRFRQPPFTPEVVRAALNPLTDSGRPAGQEAACGAPATNVSPTLIAVEHPLATWPRRRPGIFGVGALVGALVVGLTSTAFGLLGGRTAIATVARPDPTTYSQATLERGRQLAALGNCVTCHTAPGGQPNAGGLAMPTPFGTIHSTNLTPDAETGIGNWSLAAFTRAMREGISRDGHHLYPAFPYVAFARTTNEDMTALYAWLMAQEPVRQEALANTLSFPFNQRPLMGVWKALYPAPTITQNTASANPDLWNRGEYLVNGLGHCSACHTSRDALGAERSGRAYLGGALVDGWEAPALTSVSSSPVPWTEQAFYAYLRTGHHAEHGSASGPMAPVVRQLGGVSDADIQAMAHYLASFQAPVSDQAAAEAARAEVSQARAGDASLLGPAQRMFESACAACHHDGDGPRLLGVNVPLALNSNLHSARPDNVIRVILEGVRDPASTEIGFMQGFANQFDTQQLAQLIAYMRSRFAPRQPPWEGLDARIEAIRSGGGLHLP